MLEAENVTTPPLLLTVPPAVDASTALPIPVWPADATHDLSHSVFASGEPMMSIEYRKSCELGCCVLAMNS
jgi:hypothetical protein